MTSRTATRARALLAGGALLAVLIAGGACGNGPARPATSTPSTAAGPSCLAGPALSAGPTSAAGQPLPDLTLSCFDTGRKVRLADLRGPAIVNLWATYCQPCLQELPALRRYAQLASGKLRLVGVVTADRHDAARSFIDVKRLDFAMLEDRDQQLFVAVHAKGLPATLFVTAEGRLAFVYNGPALDDAKIKELAAEHLGVVTG